MRRLLAAAICLLTALPVGCGASPTPAEDTPPVYADWSRLAPDEPADSAGPLYSLFQPYSGDGPLQPRDDYGTLLPYMGVEVTVNNYILDKLPLYGLATADSQVVTEPVYADIRCLDGFLLLYRGTDALYQQENSFQERGDFSLTAAALDGRWVRNADGYYFVGSISVDGEHLLVLGGADGALTFWNTDGKTVAGFPSQAFQPYFETPIRWGYEGGPWLEWKNGVGYVTAYEFKGQSSEADDLLRLYLDLHTGEVLLEPPEGYPAEPDYADNTPDALSLSGYRNLSPEIDPITGETYYFGYLEKGGCNLLDQAGNVLLVGYSDWYIGFPQIMDGKAAVYERSAFCWYDLTDGACVFRYPLRSNTD